MGSVSVCPNNSSKKKKKTFLKTVIIFTITFGDSNAPEIINFTFKDKGFQIKLIFLFMFL